MGLRKGAVGGRRGDFGGREGDIDKRKSSVSMDAIFGVYIDVRRIWRLK